VGAPRSHEGGSASARAAEEGSRYVGAPVLRLEPHGHVGRLPRPEPPVKLRFWGVRGSIPAPGEETSRYGGNTACVEISAPGFPPLVFDCGTGARKLGPVLLSRPERELHLVFTHFHLDHVFGFPFFAPIYAPSFSVTITAPAFHPDGAKDRLARYLNGIFHPVRLSEVPAQLKFEAIRPQRDFMCGPWQMRSVGLNHPGGACAYRVSNGTNAFVYITDTAPLSRPGEGLSGGLRPNGREMQLIELMRDADAVVFDTMFSYNEYLEKMNWGHSYPEYAVALCKEAGAKKLLLFHHAPDACDADLDALAAVWAPHVHPYVELAREGLEVSVEG